MTHGEYAGQSLCFPWQNLCDRNSDLLGRVARSVDAVPHCFDQNDGLRGTFECPDSGVRGLHEFRRTREARPFGSVMVAGTVLARRRERESLGVRLIKGRIEPL